MKASTLSYLRVDNKIGRLPLNEGRCNYLMFIFLIYQINTAMKKKMDVYRAIVILNERNQKTKARVHTVYIGLLGWVPQAALLKP